MSHTHTNSYTAIVKKGILPFFNSMNGPQGIMLSEFRQRDINAVWYHLCVESKKAKLTEMERKMVVPVAGGLEKREGDD